MSSGRHVLLSRSCIALVLQGGASVQGGGHAVFSDFLRQNSMCFWNACLSRSVSSLEYRGCLVPCTLLVSGTDFALEVVRSAWARRVLRPPEGYNIVKVGDIGSLEMTPVSQTQFAPLSEALCKVVADLNGENISATAATIRVKLNENFPEMQVPGEDILYKTLGGLIKERKLYHTGNGYFVAGPDTYRQLAASPLCERQMLMTNEEAIVRLHGSQKECSLAVQVDEMDIAAAWRGTASYLHATRKDVSCQITQQDPTSTDMQYLERSHSLKILRSNKARPKSAESTELSKGSLKENTLSYLGNELTNNISDLQKSEKQSMLTKILKRMQSLKVDKSHKHVAFAAQFPPLEWLETAKLPGHSVATQTYKVETKSGRKRLEENSPKIPWDDLDKGITYYFNSSGLPKSNLINPNMSNGHKNSTVQMRQNSLRLSPSHRYSHGPFNNYAKRRHKHRRSSSESPKIHKNNQRNNSSTGSKSPTENSDTKVSFSSSNGPTPTANPKAVVNPRLKVQGSPLIGKHNIPNYTLPLRDGAKQCETSSTYTNEAKLVEDNGTRQSPKPVARTHEVSYAANKKIKDAPIYSPKLYKSSTNGIIPGTWNNPIPSTCNNPTKECPKTPSKSMCQDSEDDRSLSVLSDAKLGLSDTFSDASLSCNGMDSSKKSIDIKPLILKNFVEIPKPTIRIAKKLPPSKEIIIDNSVSVEVALDKNSLSNDKKKNNVATTVVTEETTVTKGKGNSKVVTVTSITTSLLHGGKKEVEKLSSEKITSEDVKDKSSINDLSLDTGLGSSLDCSSSCNIVTEVK